MRAALQTALLSLALIGIHSLQRYLVENRVDLESSGTLTKWNELQSASSRRKTLSLSEVRVNSTTNYAATTRSVSTPSAASVECKHLHHVNQSSRCHFVLTNDECRLSDGFLQYVHFTYCDLPDAVVLALIILFVWLLFLFILLGSTADDYFCPSLNIISKTLKMSQNVAGVTFLAYGNGAPDIFSAIAAFSHSKQPGAAQLGIQALFGAGMFVTTVVVGSVVLCTGGFTLNNRPFVRDVLFYLGAVAWMFIAMYKENITTLESIGFIIFYVVYVIVVIAGRYLNQRWKKKQAAAAVVNSGEAVISPVLSDNEDETVPLLTPIIINLPKRTENLPPLKKLARDVTPFTCSEFEQSGLFRKVFLVIQAPAILVLNLTIPVVDFDKTDQNWNKWLNVIHCITAPMFCVLATKVGDTLLGGRFPVWALTLCISVVLAIFIATTTSYNKPPRCHWMFGYLAFIVSVIWIYVTANEIVNILQTFGIALSLSNAILGLTFLAWGNSIGDLVADTTMARQGFPNMAVSACFGGPMLNLLLGIGIACTMASVSQGHPVMLTHRYHQYLVSAGFLVASLASSAVVIPLMGFRLTRSYGLYLLLLYLAYLAMSVATEIKHI